ncbi:hypothetical protein JOD57_000830 [Geodermatophilus bullaregiensis]|nr:hypothetical protein [Geodermatophilus bullaregiensis]
MKAPLLLHGVLPTRASESVPPVRGLSLSLKERSR